MLDENKTTLSLCRFLNNNLELEKQLKNEDLNYPYILGELLFNRMGGIAYGVLKNNNLLKYVNREFKSTLEIIYNAQCEKTKSFIKSLKYLSEILSKVNIPYVLLKGAKLVNIYPLGYRTSNDIDILISKTNVTTISNLLLKNGFKQGYVMSGEFVAATRKEIIYSKLNRGETVPFIKEINQPQMRFLEIDLNLSLDFKPSQGDIISDFLNEDNCYKNSIGLKMLKDCYFISHLCVHLFKEATIYDWVEMKRDLSLYKFCDLYLMLSSFKKENFEELFLTIKKFNLQKECYYAILYTKMLFSIDDANLDMFLNLIKPNNTEFLNEVFYPKNKKIYKYPEKFTIEKRIFNKNRKAMLVEINE